VAVLGATGQTGRRAVAAALERGLEVSVVSRQPGALELEHPALERHAVDVLAGGRGLRRALEGCEAVVSALGAGTSRAPTVLYSQGIANVLAASDGPTLAVVSAVPVGKGEGQAALERRVAIPLLRRLFASTYADMERMELALASSGRSWTALRAPRLIRRGPTGRLRVATEPLRGARQVTCGDLAEALLDAVTRPRGIAYVAS
jgi:putative NADH-flavin reductase